MPEVDAEQAVQADLPQYKRNSALMSALADNKVPICVGALTEQKRACSLSNKVRNTSPGFAIIGS